jgi:Tat protein secretion system quality control protein TatD with DNase activity
MRRINALNPITAKVVLKTITFSTKYNKPVVIHCVAFDELIILKKSHISVPIIIHGFSKKCNRG